MEINERTGIVVIDQKRYHLTKYEMKVLVELRKPGLRTYADIYHALYNIRPDIVNETGMKSIKNLVGNVRRKTGLRIQNYSGYGYELGGTNGEI